MALERIYIGGLNPPRLSGKDILKRLKSLDTIEIKSSSIAGQDDESENDFFQSGGKPYLHLTASSKDDTISALSIVHKHYHNVKWKGCKLVVELAKPHFLDRLAQERSEREKRKTEAEESMAAISKDSEAIAPEEPSRIPRRLRVRKKHGDTAVHIDTKPWTVETWSRFNKARTKLKQREEKHNANALANNNKNTKDESFSPSGPLMHRAVHIRFSPDDPSSMNGNAQVRPIAKHDNSSGMISSDESSTSSSSSDSGSESESSRGSIAEKDTQSPTKQTSERYEWSDDDSDSDDSGAAHTPTNKTVDFDSKSRVKQDHKQETYHWSTDEDSDEEEDDRENTNSTFPSRENKQQLKPVSGTQEFEAGFEDASDFYSDEDEKSYDLHQGANGNSESDLVGDVTSNLNILSSIFPDMANTKPMNPDSEEKSKIDSENQSSPSVGKSNSSSLGFMPRFDPSAKSSSKYILKDEQQKDQEEEEEANRSPEEKQDEHDMDENREYSDDEKKNENNTREKLPDVSTVYEQDKLENVFRNARDAWGADENPAPVSGNSTNDSTVEDPSQKTSMFSFGFKLGGDDSGKVNKEPTSESGSANNSFSFSFNVPEQYTNDATTISGSNDAAVTKEKDSHDEMSEAIGIRTNDYDDESVVDDAVERQRGLTLPDKDLRKYVDNFFACNNGLRIMQNPQEFMNDDKERTEWNNERQTLTLDWKRKRKYAITRIQKRMKIRRR